MRRAFLAVFALAAACSRSPVPSAQAAVTASNLAAAPAAPAEPGLSGRVAERIDASQYSYLRLRTPSGETWAAVPRSDIAVGAQATIVNAAWMENFTSKTLSRTWPRIAFGTLAEEPAGAARTRAPGAGAGMFAQQAAQVPRTSAPADEAPAPGPALTRAATRQGRTIAEVYAHKTALKDKTVAVRGKVVKEVDGVLGKNWLHLRDGTGAGPSADLAVTTDATAKVGDVVVVTGLVHLDRDLGAGYRYEILLEDAQLQREPQVQ